jgi:hypothetical protein
MGIFTRLFRGGQEGGDRDDEDDAPDREGGPAVAPGLVAATAGASSFAIAGPGETLMAAKPDEPAPRSRAALPGLPPRQKEQVPAPPVVPDDKDVKVTFNKKSADKNDSTMVMSPPPPAAPTRTPTPVPRSAAPAPAPAPPAAAPKSAPAPAPARKKPD